MPKHGILLFNLGGPTELKDVEPFLYELFSDPEILVGMNAFFRKTLAFLISKTKAPSSKKMYQEIGGGSPILKWTTAQADGLQQRIDSEKKKMRVEIAMRASRPNIEDALNQLHHWGADSLTLFPLFPHFSTTTTGSCFKETQRILRKMNWNLDCLFLKSWADHPKFIRLLRQRIQLALEKQPNSSVLFSAHSLPMKIIERGDIYPQEIEKTIRATTEGLNVPWSLAYQSRNGPVPWLEPYVDREIKRLGEQGTKRLILVPMSFVSDHIETLFEIDIELAKIAKESGIEKFSRTESFNDDPAFFDVLYSVLKDFLKKEVMQLSKTEHAQQLQEECFSPTP